MDDLKNKNAVAALLKTYEQAITQLINTIQPLEDQYMHVILDTNNEECKSLQAILTHVVSAGYSYAVYIQNHRGIDAVRPERRTHQSSINYQEDLNHVLTYTQQVFQHIYDNELEVFDRTKKINTKWGQQYDIEQLMEHAIVHVLRHTLQVQKIHAHLLSHQH